MSITHIIITRETRTHLYCTWGVVVYNFFYCLDIIFFRWRRSMLVNCLLHHPVPEGEHIANRETRRHLYCMRGVGVGSFFCCVDIFWLRRIM